MKIGSEHPSANPYVQKGIAADETKREEFKEKVKSGEISGKKLTEAYLVEYTQKAQQNSVDNFAAQGGVFDLKKVRDLLETIDFEAIGYDGKPIADMTPEEAAALVSEDGFFGIKQTSERVAGFVISGAGEDLERLKAGREGVVRGFEEAEAMWGGKLPDISYQTQERTLALIDERIAALGGNLLDTSI